MGTMAKPATFWILTILILAGCEATLASPATPALIAEVLAALDKGDAPNAARLADVALHEDAVGKSQQASLLLYRGLARVLLGENISAREDFTHALDTNALPADERELALLQRALLHDAAGKLNQAVSDYSAAIELRGVKAATALNNRANIYRRQNELEKARRDYLAALSAGGGRAQFSYYGLGRIAEARHDLKGARDFYVKAVTIDPRYAPAAERLTALGAPPGGVVLRPDDEIILRPPSRTTPNGTSKR